MVLCLLLSSGRNPEIDRAWVPRLHSEWKKWEVLGDGDKATKTIEELSRALERKRLRVDTFQYCTPASILAKVQKWEFRIQTLRKQRGAKYTTMCGFESMLLPYLNGTHDEAQDKNGLHTNQELSE